MYQILILAILAVASDPTIESVQYTIPSNSDTQAKSVNLPDGGSAVEIQKASSWVSISGSSWIWDGNNEDAITVTFTRTFYLYCQATSISLIVAADNSFTTKFNDQNPNCHGDNYGSTATCLITSYAIQGLNTLNIIVTNGGGPGGLVYQIDIKCQFDNSLTSGNCLCNTGYYWNTLDSLCEICYKSCLNCTGSAATECNSCVSPFSLQIDKTCSCESHYYLDGTVCSACDSSCLNCTGPLSTDCISCENGFYLYNSSCLPCNSKCFNCTGGISTDCIECKAGLTKLSDNSCTCGNHYYWNSSACIDCYGTCLDCAGPSKDECTSCTPGLIFERNTTCVCPNGTYWDSSKCNECYETCGTCYGNQSFNCLSCINDAYFMNGSCTCNGYYDDINRKCASCSHSCLNCSGPEYYNCVDCKGYLLDVVCLPTCPVGYNKVGKRCAMIQSLAMSYAFNTIQPVCTSPSQCWALGTGQNTYPYFDTTDPIPAYGRGFYFNGNSSYLSFPNSNSTMVLGIKFFISIWFNPSSSTGYLLHKSSDQFLLSVSLSTYIAMVIQINSELYNYTSARPYNLNQWNYLLVSVDYINATYLSFNINQLQTSTFYISRAAFIDSLASSMYVGSSSSIDRGFYRGFVYSIEIYLEKPSVGLATQVCNGCSVCPLTSICLPVCGISSYYSNTSECDACQSNCTYGCRDANDCNLCTDKNCLVCTDYSQNSCTKCGCKYKLVNGNCIFNRPNEYYDNITRLCYQCYETCLTCNSLYECTSCYPFSTLYSNYTCICDLGYHWNTTQCSRNFFSAVCSANTNNIVKIIFKEPLENNLIKENIQVRINDSPQSYEIVYINFETYELDITFVNDVETNDKLYITFMSNITSNKNSLLNTKVLETFLYPTEGFAEANKIKKIKAFATEGVTVGLSTVFGSSFITFDPTSLFNFLNTAEILAIIFLFNLPVGSALPTFLCNLRVQKNLPNVFNYIFDANLGKHLPGLYSDFGMKTSLILINSGISLLILSIFITAYGLLKIINFCFPKLSRVFNTLIKYFEFHIFLRFWIQVYQEILLNWILELTYNDFSTWVLVMDFIITILLIVCQILGLCTFIWVVYKRSRLYEYELKDFSDRYGTYFIDFKSKEISSLLFYFLYILRRTGLVLLVLYCPDGYLALIVSYTFSVAVLLYVIAAMPFKNLVYNIYHIVNEILVCAVHITIFCHFIPEFNISVNYMTDNCINFITIAWAMNMACSIIGPVYGAIANFIRKRKHVSVIHEPNAPHTSINNYGDTNITLSTINFTGDLDFSQSIHAPHNSMDNFTEANINLNKTNITDNTNFLGDVSEKE